MQNDPDMRNNPFAGLGMMVMPAIIAKMVDAFVTPEGISALVKRGKVEGGTTGAEVGPRSTTTTTTEVWTALP